MIGKLRAAVGKVVTRGRLGRHAAATPYIVDRPGIELSQGYGGWNADAYDAGTGHDRSWFVPIPVTPWDDHRRRR